MEAGCRLSHVAIVEADTLVVRVKMQVADGFSQLVGVSVQRSIFSFLLPTGGQVTCSQLVQVPVLLLYYKHTRTRTHHYYCTWLTAQGVT